MDIDDEEEYQSRKRTPAFSPWEKEYLIDIVSRYRSIIESKRFDCGSILEKNRAWTEITNYFNSVPQHQKRSLKQLRKRWDNFKTQKRRQHVDKLMEDFNNSQTSIEMRDDAETSNGSLNNSEIIIQGFQVANESAVDTIIPDKIITGDFDLVENVKIEVLENNQDMEEEQPLTDSSDSNKTKTPPKYQDKNKEVGCSTVLNPQLKSHRKVISLLEEEARWKVDAAKEEFQEKVLRRKQAEVELEMAKTKLEELKKRILLNSV